MDPRIKVALVAFSKLEALEKSNRLRTNLSPLRQVLMSLKWIEDVNYLRTESKKFADLNYNFKHDEKEKLSVKWCVDILKNLPKRLMRDGTNSILLGLDCGLGEVLSLRKLEHGLSVCKISSKLGELTVITNLKIKKGDKLPFCILPPTEFQGIMSEAMFLSGPVGSLTEVDWKNVEGTVSAILEKP
ncbi:MAG: hypothetical protein GOU98_05030 [Candidatus Altiarchaeota archaeon]|nr:hypothetical protein [Candidatus Altiarchaeota archaeon]